MTPGGGGAPELRSDHATGAPAVLMMVGNDISHDTRVLKSALALADAGLAVTLLGYSPSGRREEAMLGSVHVIRVPVSWTLRDADRRRREARRQPLLRIGPDPEHRRAQDLRAGLRQDEAAAGSGPSAWLRARLTRLGLSGARARAALQRRTERAESLAWRGYDAARHRSTLGATWRRALPEIDDYELAFGAVVDQLPWQVIHAHDVHLVGVASRAVARRRAEGRRAAWIYDAHEFVAGLSLYGSRTRRRRHAYLDLESEFIGDADAVVTVSPALAGLVQHRYRLPERPAVVMNSPELAALATEGTGSLRAQLGLDADVPLAVYAGAVTSARGIAAAVEALPLLPQVHLAVLAVPGRGTPAAVQLADQASALGVADRLHLLDPVAPDSVSSFVATADVGLSPLLHFPSHEVALPNKLFEYLHGGLPVLVSDCSAQAEFVREHGVGRVHTAGDAASLAAELAALLADRDRWAAAVSEDLLTPYAWERQSEVLRSVYERLVGADLLAAPAHPTRLAAVSEAEVVRQERPSVVGFGPANMAGQAWEWAKAIERELPGLRSEVMAVDRGSALVFEADSLVPQDTFARDRGWAESFEAHALQTWTHALLEAGRPMFGLRHGRDFTADVPVLRSAGIEVGLLLHGSEIRNPRRHGASSQWSPFRDQHEDLTMRLQRQWDTLHPLVTGFDGPVFVSTPDLLEDVPGALLLPVVVDVEAWACDAPVLERDRPVVLHAPSRASLKGSDHVEAAMAGLVAAGLVDYRRIEGVAPSEMPATVAECDILLDQFTLGSYGVLAVQGMAAGRVVVAHVPEPVRRLCPGELPIVEADPGTLADVVRDLVTGDRSVGRAAAAAGPAYAAAVHGGVRSATVLREALGLRGG